jgi:ubiquinone/menaquinone biosynthesis C-methylase UbiE
MESKMHWETIHRTKVPTQVSWYQEHSVLSLALVERTGIPFTGEVIDVGGGISTLADDLLNAGFSHVTVLDISAAALDIARQRLGVLASHVTWVEADITQVQLPYRAYDVWHDRAVFHFLTQPEARQSYVQAVQHSVKAGGHVIVATFAADGPTHCSGLEVTRYSPDSLHDQFGTEFRLVDSVREAHRTPFGTEQKFIYCYCRKA